MGKWRRNNSFYGTACIYSIQARKQVGASYGFCVFRNTDTDRMVCAACGNRDGAPRVCFPGSAIPKKPFPLIGPNALPERPSGSMERSAIWLWTASPLCPPFPCAFPPLRVSFYSFCLLSCWSWDVCPWPGREESLRLCSWQALSSYFFLECNFCFWESWVSTWEEFPMKSSAARPI